MRKEMTANQLVAHNLRRARAEARLTQEQVSAKLEPYLGRRWSSASFSIAERSADEGARKREFDANELLAFARVFEKPLAWFFTPPDDELEHVTCGEPLEVTRKVGRNELLVAVHSVGSEHAKTLRYIATMLEMGDMAAMNAKPAGEVGFPRIEEEEKNDG